MEGASRPKRQVGREQVEGFLDEIFGEEIHAKRVDSLIDGVDGVLFADSPTGRRATVAGSGVEVWEVIASWRSLGESWERLRAGYPWLTEPPLRAALAFYEMCPNEVDERLTLEDEWTAERMDAELRFARSPGLGPA